MHHMKKHAVSSLKRRWSGIIKSPNGVCSLVEHKPSMCVSDAGLSGFSSIVSERTAFNPGTTNRLQVLIKSRNLRQSAVNANCIIKDVRGVDGTSVLSARWQTRERIVGFCSPYRPIETHGKSTVVPCFARSCASTASKSPEEKQSETRKDISTVEDPFDAPTYNIPEKPVTFAEGASYSVIILVGLGIAAAAGYAVFKELIFEPKEYKIFGKALKRVQEDGQVRVRIGSPITGYGQESRNRAARQRIANRIWTDEDGVEHVEVNFYIRGPHGAGKVYTEMFKDKVDKQWKFTYLIAEIKSPSPAQLMLESYVPA
ncbi:hypothetical protein AAG906_005727 [Vitis piasezkii]